MKLYSLSLRLMSLSAFLLLSFNSVYGQIGSKQLIADSLAWLEELHIADFDQDGDDDMISFARKDTLIFWIENLGNRTFSKPITIHKGFPGLWTIHPVDIDQDGDLDIVAGTRGLEVAWFENTGSMPFTKHKISPDNYNATEIISGDINGDSFPDVIMAIEAKDKVVWVENLGNGIIDSTEQILTSNCREPQGVYAQDMDGDNDVDILCACNQLLFTKILLLRNSNGVFQEDTVTTDPRRTTNMLTVDLDDDGDLDVIAAKGLSNEVVWYENLGINGFSSIRNIYNTLYSPLDLSSADIDGDGDQDLIYAGYSYAYSQAVDGEIGWFENDSLDFTFHKIARGSNVVSGSHSVAISDFDQDGDPDIANSAYKAGHLSWFENFYVSPFKLKGNIFYDGNQNKQKDTLEYPLSNMRVKVKPRQRYTWSSSGGSYQMAVDPGSYNLYADTAAYWKLTTDSASYKVQLNSNVRIADNLDFGFYPDTLFHLFESSLVGGYSRCDRITTYWYDISNLGTISSDIYLKIELDPDVLFNSGPVHSVAGQEVFVKIDSLGLLSREGGSFKVEMPDYTKMGDTVTSVLRVYSDPAYSQLLDEDTLQQIIVCAYDPNDKTPFPLGVGVGALISHSQKLSYTIRFQNTGNDTAVDVLIVDQLDSLLDWNSFKIIAASHEVSTSIDQYGQVAFRFSNIYLPDSIDDEPGSHGYLKYEISPKEGVVKGSVIENTAHIFFDFNPPIVTNTTSHTIGCLLSPPQIKNDNGLLKIDSGHYQAQWYLNGSAIPGANDFEHTLAASGTYTVELTNEFGCDTLSDPFTIKDFSLYAHSDDYFQLYPNPAKGKVIIENLGNLQNLEIQLFDINGKLIKRQISLSEPQSILETQFLPQGIYMIKLTSLSSQNQVALFKLLISR